MAPVVVAALFFGFFGLIARGTRQRLSGGGEQRQGCSKPGRRRSRRDRRVFACSAAAAGLSLLALITGIVRLASGTLSEPEEQRLAADPAVDIQQPDQPAAATAGSEALPAEAPIDSQRSE